MPKIPFIFFGNEKLATGIPAPEQIILKAAVDAGFELEQHVTGHPSELRLHKSQIAVLAAYGYIVPQSLLDEFQMGIINVHPSLLPAYRGPTPIEQALLDGERKTGVSIMRLSAKMDEGPIYKQKSLQIMDGESKISLASRLHMLGAELIAETLPAIENGALKPRIQPHPDRATYSRKLTKTDGELDFSKTADELEREIRAYLEWPKSHTRLADIDVIITSARVSEKKGKPGQFVVKGKQLLLFCAQGALDINELKPAGKQTMPVAAFIAGYGNKIN